MTPHEFERMRELPALIQRTRNPSMKLRLAHELRILTDTYRIERIAAAQAEAGEARPLTTVN